MFGWSLCRCRNRDTGTMFGQPGIDALAHCAQDRSMMTDVDSQ
jgi:hypothetical protein